MKMEFSESFTLKCPQCGGTEFSAASTTPGPNDPLTCAHCGTVLQLGAVTQRIEREVKASVLDRLRGILKRR